MENENINKPNYFDKFLELIKNKKAYFISFLLIILIICIVHYLTVSALQHLVMSMK